MVYDGTRVIPMYFFKEIDDDVYSTINWCSISIILILFKYKNLLCILMTVSIRQGLTVNNIILYSN